MWDRMIHARGPRGRTWAGSFIYEHQQLLAAPPCCAVHGLTVLSERAGRGAWDITVLLSTETFLSHRNTYMEGGQWALQCAERQYRRELARGAYRRGPQRAVVCHSRHALPGVPLAA